MNKHFLQEDTSFFLDIASNCYKHFQSFSNFFMLLRFWSFYQGLALNTTAISESVQQYPSQKV